MQSQNYKSEGRNDVILVYLPSRKALNQPCRHNYFQTSFTTIREQTLIVVEEWNEF